jgi:hypothetical protein
LKEDSPVRRFGFVLILAISCSGVPRQRTPSPAKPDLPPSETPEHGLYDKPLAMMQYEVISRHLGTESTLSEDEKKVFWESIRGHDVVWTGSVFEIGQRHPLAVAVRLQVGRKSPSWDTLVFFNPEHEEKLRGYQKGDAFTFRASLESFERTTLGIQVTLVQGRFAKPPE